MILVSVGILLVLLQVFKWEKFDILCHISITWNDSLLMIILICLKFTIKGLMIYINITKSSKHFWCKFIFSKYTQFQDILLFLMSQIGILEKLWRGWSFFIFYHSQDESTELCTNFIFFADFLHCFRLFLDKLNFPEIMQASYRWPVFGGWVS